MDAPSLGNCGLEPTGEPTAGATQSGGRLERVPSPARTQLTRRHIFAGAAGLALLVAGCTTGAPHEPAPAPRDPLADLLDEHLALASAYAAAITAAPNDARLPGLAGNVTQQISALAGALALPTPATPSALSDPAESPQPQSEPAALITGVRDSETLLAAHSTQLALTQTSQRAPLLASLAAAHQCAAQVLG